MKKRFLILLSILSLSCSNKGEETNNQTEATALKLVTGINCRQNFDDPSFALGNPNILTNNKFVIYPNPANESAFIMAQENITDVWLVQANPEKIYQNYNFNNVLNTNLYSQQLISSQSNFSLNSQSSTNINLNIGALPKGYYKVFVKINGIIYWDNLYKYENGGNNQQQFTSLTNFWN